MPCNRYNSRIAVPRPAILSGKRSISVIVSVTIFILSGLAAEETSQDPVIGWMNGIAQQQLDQRAEKIRAIGTVAEAQARKQLVRAKLLEDLGGLPDYHGPLHARVVGQIHNDNFTVEKVIYESLPGFYITANLYRPNRPGRYPGVLLQAGHTQEGKPENQRLAANLALKGFVVLCFDPIGQGERVQTYSRQLDAPLAGWSVPEHIEMAAQALLIGQGLARYFIWDAMRSLDYLTSRPEVDATRLGAAGCSGGGALTTFTGGLDPRLKVVVPACYPSSFRLLFSTMGPDAEMIFPNLLASGLDTADFVEQSAPTPWLLEATETDQYHFSHEGVRLVYEEAREWYALYHAQENIGYLMGPGSHGLPLPSREAIYQWMIRYLKDGHGDYHEQPVTMYTNHELQVTASGNAENEPGSRKLYQILRADLHARESRKTIPDLSAELKNLKIPTDRSAPAVKVLHETSDTGIRQQQIRFESDPGIWLNATLYLPSASQKRPAVLMVKGNEFSFVTPQATIAGKLAKQGQVVLEMEPRTVPVRANEGPYSGDWETNAQANMIGQNLPALRAHDILRGVDLLQARSDVDPGAIRGIARGVKGFWLLLAAATDSRIEGIWLDRTPPSLRSALDNSIAADLWDAAIPGFVLHWDLDDLVKAMGSRRVLWTDPTSW
ncbi:MAG TPA: acetylxylan esterase, partial [Acidobacteriaceae bacterium]|nr:acetylxylan esterase [Acidobacteriaceae bacterium]